MFGIRSYPCVCLKITARGYARSSKNHYESLGLSSRATQAEIKKAYYKLSMQYHPDKVAGDEVKFREITSAYEVLGNVKLRRLYDSGVISDRGQAPSAEDLAKAPPPPPPEQSRFYRSRVPTSGRTQIYDFDEWSRAHYERTRNRDFESRSKHAQNMRRESMRSGQQASEFALWVSMLFLASFMFGATVLGRTDYDKPSKRPPRAGS